MENKVWWKSKTILINIICGLAASMAYIFPQANEVTIFINANASGISMVWSVLNIVLRAVSKDKIVLVD